MSYFEAAKINYDFFNKLFMRTIYIPNDLLGGDYGLGKKVKVKTVLKDKRLLSRNSPNRLQVDLYDPNDMYYWIQKVWREVKRKGKSSDLVDYQAETSVMNKMKILKIKK